MRYLIFKRNRNHIQDISAPVQNRVAVKTAVPAHWQSTNYVSSASVVPNVSTRKTSSCPDRINEMSRIINKKRLSYRK